MKAKLNTYLFSEPDLDKEYDPNNEYDPDNGHDPDNGVVREDYLNGNRKPKKLSNKRSSQNSLDERGDAISKMTQLNNMTRLFNMTYLVNRT